MIRVVAGGRRFLGAGRWRAGASGGWRAERKDPEERRGRLRGPGRWRASKRRGRWRARGLISWKARSWGLEGRWGRSRWRAAEWLGRWRVTWGLEGLRVGDFVGRLG